MISGAPAFAPSETPCSSRPDERVFAGVCWGSEALRTMPLPPTPWSCRAERSEAETPPRIGRIRAGPLPPWGSLRSVPTAVGTAVETTCFLGDPPPPPPQVLSSRVETSLVCKESASPARLLVVSSGAERSRDTSTNRPDTIENATSVGSLHAAPTAVGTLQVATRVK